MALLTHEEYIAISAGVARFRATTERRRVCAEWKLDPEQVKEIRQSPLPQAELAKLYGVHRCTISFVIRRKRWGSIE